MVVLACLKTEVEGDESDVGTPPPPPPPQPEAIKGKSKPETLVEVFVPRWSPTRKHVVIVMDALRVFSKEPLLWTLNNVTRSGFIVTLLGVMPWIPLALSCKTMLDVWKFDLGDLSSLAGKGERNDLKYQKIRGIIELCEQKGVVPYMRVAMGHPLKLVVLEQTSNLHATLVVLDRHLRKNKAFYAERLPSSVVLLMNGDGGVDMLKNQSTIDFDDSSPEETPSTLPPKPQVIISEALSELLIR